MNSDPCYTENDFYDFEQPMEEMYMDLLIDQLHDMAEDSLDVLHTV